MTTCGTRTRQNLEQAFAVEGRNYIRCQYLAEVAEADGDADLAAALREVAVHEDLHAMKLFELAARDGEDPFTHQPIRTAAEVLLAALAYQRRQAQEAYLLYAKIARAEGRVDEAEWFDRHAEATVDQVERLEALQGRH